MPSETFHNLPDDKKERIIDALLNEFSSYPLADAKVSRIVKEANIARGAFYKYFQDIKDAYFYILKKVRSDFHLSSADRNTETSKYIDSIRRLILETKDERYLLIIRLHFQKNSVYLNEELPSEIFERITSLQWARMILIHNAIREVLMYPKSLELILHHLQVALDQLDGLKE